MGRSESDTTKCVRYVISKQECQKLNLKVLPFDKEAR